MAHRSGEMGRLAAANAGGEKEGNVRQPLRNSDIKRRRPDESSHKGPLTASGSGSSELYFHVIWSFAAFTLEHWEEVETLFMALAVNVRTVNGAVSLGRSLSFSMEIKATFNGSLQQ